ncbi:MAG: CBS domain-containing ParB/RepB/Spo0J family partition protein [Methanobrevibacter sp.]
MSDKALVKDYMTKNVISLEENTPCEKVIQIMKKTGHDGFPVVNSDGNIVGIITTYDLLLKDWSETIKEVMSKDVVIAREDMALNDASRVMFRQGISRMPVVNKEGKLSGFLTNTDIVRSHIERSTPTKVNYYKDTLSMLYDTKATVKEMKVAIKDIRPTQDKIYADELDGRIYELKRGLAEPAIVVHTGKRWILIDGHHRAVASVKLGCKYIESYVITLDKDIKLGVEKTADKYGVHTLRDIHIINDDQHPLIAITESIKENKDKKIVGKKIQ